MLKVLKFSLKKKKMRRSKASKQELHFKVFITCILKCSKAVNIYKNSMYNEQHVQYVSCLLWSPYIKTAFSCLFSFWSESGEVFEDIRDQLDKRSYAGCFIAWQHNICNSLATTSNSWKGQNHIWTSCFFTQFFIANLGSVRFIVMFCILSHHVYIIIT